MRYDEAIFCLTNLSPTQTCKENFLKGRVDRETCGLIVLARRGSSPGGKWKNDMPLGKPRAAERSNMTRGREQALYIRRSSATTGNHMKNEMKSSCACHQLVLHTRGGCRMFEPKNCLGYNFHRIV